MCIKSNRKVYLGLSQIDKWRKRASEFERNHLHQTEYEKDQKIITPSIYLSVCHLQIRWMLFKILGLIITGKKICDRKEFWRTLIFKLSTTANYKNWYKGGLTTKSVIETMERISVKKLIENNEFSL